MPIDSIDIYVDTSFLDYTAVSATEDLSVDVFFQPADNIGARNLEVNYYIGEANLAGDNFDVDTFLAGSGTAATEDKNVVYYITQTKASGFNDSSVDYDLPLPISGTPTSVNLNAVYFAAYGTAQTFSDNLVDVFYGVGQEGSASNVVVYYLPVITQNSSTDLNNTYTVGYGISGTEDTIQDLSIGSFGTVNSGVNQVYIDFFVANYIYGVYNWDVITGNELIKNFPFQSTAVSGSLTPVPFDVILTSQLVKNIGTDIFCCLVDYGVVSMESQTVVGGLDWKLFEVFSGVVDQPAVSFDIDLNPIKISELYGETSPGFLLEEGEHMAATGSIYVEITDDVYTITTSGTYWEISGTVVSGTFVPITDGYRMYYDPADDFASFVGSTEVKVHAENDNGDYNEKFFYLTSGYVVEYDNIDQDYGFDERVVIWMTAENYASCPVSTTFAYYFETKELYSRDLAATIVGTPSTHKDLPATISPQTDLLFLYGKEFTIEVRAADYAGNEMEPYIFEFKIEDDPNS